MTFAPLQPGRAATGGLARPHTEEESAVTSAPPRPNRAATEGLAGPRRDRVEEVTSAPLHLARPAIRALEAYQSARSTAAEAEVFLDANESPWPPLEEPGLAGLNRYPEPQPARLLARLAELYGVVATQVMVGRGADDAIDALVRCFCEPGGDAVLVCEPTYGLYEVAAGIQGCGVVRLPLGAQFELDPAALLAAWRPEVKLVFLCSPNNPTGNVIDPGVVAELCVALAGHSLVVVDEAYVELSETGSVVGLLAQHANLVVLRTLSKAWALAGARCGSAIAHPEIIGLLQKVRAPYPLSRPAVAAVERALGPAGVEACKHRVALLVRERETLAAALGRLPGVERVYPSQANFLLVRSREPAALVAGCRAAGVLVRDRSQLAGLRGCVRISIGAPEENRRLLAALGAAPTRSESGRA